MGAAGSVARIGADRGAAGCDGAARRKGAAMALRRGDGAARGANARGEESW